jgi:hypothetical protein
MGGGFGFDRKFGWSLHLGRENGYRITNVSI